MLSPANVIWKLKTLRCNQLYHWTLMENFWIFHPWPCVFRSFQDGGVGGGDFYGQRIFEIGPASSENTADVFPWNTGCNAVLWGETLLPIYALKNGLFLPRKCSDCIVSFLKGSLQRSKRFFLFPFHYIYVWLYPKQVSLKWKKFHCCLWALAHIFSLLCLQPPNSRL